MALFRLASLVVFTLAAVELVLGAAVTTQVTCSTGQVVRNAVCCRLFPIVDIIQRDLFDGGECGEEAHSALRLAFHDAIGFSLRGGLGGGADGSILIFNATETAFHANEGTDDITSRQFPVFQETGLSAGDFVHLAAAVGTSNCAGAPRLAFQFGRPPPRAPAPDLTVPEPTDSITKILARMADAGFSPAEVIALLSSHSIAAADAIDPTIPGTPFDSTVETFDTQVFLEVLLQGTLFPGNGSQPGEVLSPIAGEMRLQSDAAFARDSRTACLWQAMINNQSRMQTQFKAAMAKMQTLGQRNLIDCSEVVPVPAPFTQSIRFPPSFSSANIEQACTQTAFPALATQPGPAPTIPPVPGS